MIGRLEAPGAKLEPVMPGLENNRSPSVLAGVRRSSSFGTTVTVANWSVTIGSTPGCGVSGTGDAVGGPPGDGGEGGRARRHPALGGLGVSRSSLGTFARPFLRELPPRSNHGTSRQKSSQKSPLARLFVY